jgi:hypothetical protein
LYTLLLIENELNWNVNALTVHKARNGSYYAKRGDKVRTTKPRMPRSARLAATREVSRVGSRLTRLTERIGRVREVQYAVFFLKDFKGLTGVRAFVRAATVGSRVRQSVMGYRPRPRRCCPRPICLASCERAAA